MIKSLYIKDYAIIKELDIDFLPGLTVITGETGAGKSILLKAIEVSLGAKINKQMVRSNSDRAVIVSKFKDIEIRRIITHKGRSKIYLNDTPIPLIKLINNYRSLIDFHGQHDQQLILNNHFHIDYLDQYCKHQNEVGQLIQISKELFEINVSLQKLKKINLEKNDRLALLKFQANEIDIINPTIDEDTSMRNLFKKLNNSQKIKEILESTLYALSAGEPSLEQQIAQVQNDLTTLLDFDSSLMKISQLLKEAIINLEEASTEIHSQVANLDVDDEEIHNLQERINAYDLLKRKYGGSIESVIDYRQNIQQEISSLDNSNQTEKSLMSDIKEKEVLFTKIAIRVHKKRKIEAKKLSKLIEEKMSDLNMPNSKFVIKVIQKEKIDAFVNFDNKLYESNSKGIDIVEFFISTNPGEVVKPFANVASGGEISRIMLAIKTVFQNLDPVKTLVFDEIDTGISGEAAKKVSNHLLNLSKSKQVICISHLSQIVVNADNHLHISKFNDGKNTLVEVRYLNKNQRSEVISSLFQGSKIGVS